MFDLLIHPYATLALLAATAPVALGAIRAGDCPRYVTGLCIAWAVWFLAGILDALTTTLPAHFA